MTRSTHYPRYQRFLEALRDARQSAGVTQTQVAERLGNRQVFISKLERGERRMDVVDFLEYCDAAGIDALSLFEHIKTAVDGMPKPRLGKLAINRPRPTRKNRSKRGR